MKGLTSVTVSVPLTIRRRGGRKQIIGPDGAMARQGECGAGVVPVRGDPALVKALARGFRWRRMLEEGRYGSISEMAKAEDVERGYVGSLLRLTLLPPAMVEAIVAGRQPEGVPVGWISREDRAVTEASCIKPTVDPSARTITKKFSFFKGKDWEDASAGGLPRRLMRPY